MKNFVLTVSVFFTVILVIQFLLSFIGLEHTDHDISDHSETHDHNFKLISIRGIVAFFAMTGWSILGFHNLGLPNIVIGILSLLVGFSTMILISVIMYIMERLAQENKIDYSKLINKFAEVYINIPSKGNGFGKVFVNLNDKKIEMKAVTNDDECILTSHLAQIERITDDNVLIVTSKF